MVEWIKPGVDFDFIGRARLFITISLVAVTVSVLALVGNAVFRGSPLNYGNDFKGGSEVHVEFGRDVPPDKVRSALESHGYKAAEVVRMEHPQRPHFYMVRLGEVAAYSKAQVDKAKATLSERFKDEGLKKLDFSEGGDKLFVRFGKSVDGAALTEALKAAGLEPQHVEPFGRPDDHAYQVTLVGLDFEMRRAFEKSLGAGIVKDIPQIESVGAKVGKQLRTDGIRSLIYTLILILLYIAVRFNFEFAPGAVVALMHDVFLITGLFAILWREFSLQTVAALLTTAGYSINDTIVQFDRVRENLTRLRERNMVALVNTSLNETLSRTILTNLTVFITTASVWYFARGPVRDFAMAMSFGVLVGTYSTLFIASPLYLWLHERGARRAKPT